MSGATLVKPARCLMAAGALATLAIAGCFPVAWLPDSSGFIYTDGAEFQQLVHYDVAKSERNVLVEKTPASTLWPALSPDGKTIAVARLIRAANVEKTLNLQVIEYDLKGKETHRSSEFEWTKEWNGNNDGPLGTGVYWATSDGKLIIYNYDDPVKTGIYDATKKSLALVDGCPAAFGGTPIRPDGKGFLVTQKNSAGDPLRVFLVDWEGKTQTIDMKPDSIDTDSKVSMIQFPWSCASGWKGQVAELSSGANRIRIDTDKRVGTFAIIPQSEAIVDGKELYQQYVFPGGAKVRVLGEEQMNQTKYQLEFVAAGDNKSKIVSQLEKKSFVLSPSPDRKWLAARIVGDEKTIFLINAKGEVKEIPGSSAKPD